MMVVRAKVLGVTEIELGRQSRREIRSRRHWSRPNFTDQREIFRGLTRQHR
jgi:hypothetical protein